MFIYVHIRSMNVSTQKNIHFPTANVTTHQDPSKADNLYKVQQDLDETKIILHKTIESVLERGEKLDNLVQKSSDLSTASQLFYKQARHAWTNGIFCEACRLYGVFLIVLLGPNLFPTTGTKSEQLLRMAVVPVRPPGTGRFRRRFDNFTIVFVTIADTMDFFR